MSMSAFRLLQLHQRIDAQISRERIYRLPDVLRLQKLKKLKLAVKDRLHRLSLGRRDQRAG